MIQVIELHKSFAGHQVLKGVNLTIEPGKITTIIGGSGGGKTVLLKHLNALLIPDRGQIMVDGVDITQLRQKKLNKMRDKREHHRFGGGATYPGGQEEGYDPISSPQIKDSISPTGANKLGQEDRVEREAVSALALKDRHPTPEKPIQGFIPAYFRGFHHNIAKWRSFLIIYLKLFQI